MDKKKLRLILVAVALIAVVVCCILLFKACGGQETDPPTTTTTGHEHMFDDGEITKEATCVATGLKVYTCKDCGETKEEELPATGEHTYGEGEVTKLPTTEKEGVMTYHCTVCDHVKEEVLPVLCEHEFDDGVVTKEPTCVDAGVKTHTCGKCGETTELKIPADPDAHSYQDEQVTKEPTCISNGVKTVKCEHCGETREEVIPATGVHTYDEGKMTKEPTEKDPGEKTFTCIHCGRTKMEYTPMSDGHKYDEGTTVKEATCSVDGVRKFQCTECDHSIELPIPATGEHEYDAGTVTKAPTCVAPGVKTHKCVNCDSTMTTSVPASNVHTYGEGTVTKKPTCAEPGEKTYQCVHCDSTKKEAIPASGTHSYDEGKVTKEPTCTAAGVKTYTCKTCGSKASESIKKTGHTMGQWVEILAPTMNDYGLERSSCAKCDYYEERSIDKLPAAYYITVDDGTGKIIQVGVAEDGKYALEAPAKIGYNFGGWVDASGKAFDASGEISANTQISAVWNLDGTDTLAELVERAAAGVDKINISADITVTEPIYIVGNTAVYSDGNYALKRDPGYAGDMFVIGHDKDGVSSVLMHRRAILTLGGGKGTLTIDGNRDNLKVKVVGTALFVTESATVDLHDGIVLANHKKEGNERAYLWTHLMSNVDYAGGAAIQIVCGTVNMYGGIIENNLAQHEITTVTNEDGSTTKIGRNAYGGAIQNCGNFYMYGGVIRNNEGNRGGGIYNWANIKIYAGTFSGNKASGGGAIASSSHIYIGSECDGYANMGGNLVTFNNNTATSNGGAIYAGSGDSVLILGNTVFSGNKSEKANGGAIATSGPLTIRSAKFVDNTCVNGGGAIYHYYNNPELIVRIFEVTDTLFEGNIAGKGGAVSLGASTTAEEAGVGTKSYFSNCNFVSNQATKENGGTGSGGALYLSKFSSATVDDSAFTSNAAANLGGAVNSTGTSKLTITNTTFNTNTSTGKGGAISAYGGTTLKVSGASFTGNASTADSASAMYISGITATLSDITLTNNTTPSSGTIAIYSGAKVTVTSCVAESNTAKYGAVFFNDDASLTVKKGADGVLEFKNNDASTGNGGFLCASGTATADVSDALVSGNTAKKGGAIICGSGVTLNLNRVEFTGNKAVSGVTTHGGGVLMMGAANVTITDCKIEGNSSRVNAGVVYAATGGVLKITDTSIIGNTSGRYGGAIYAEGASVDISSNTQLLGNSAKNGGAICLFAGEDANAQRVASNLIVSDVTIKDNSATGNGGALYSNGSEYNVTNTKFLNNKASNVDYGGGALYTSGSIGVVTGSEFTGNSADVGGVADLRSKSVLTISNSTISGNTAVQGGGAVYAKNATLNLVGSTVNGNSALNTGEDGARGGAIHAAGSATVNVEGSSFEANVATTYGGAIFASGAKEVKLSNGTAFTNHNNATGAVAYIHDTATFTATDVRLSNNISGNNGIMYIHSTTAVLDNVTASGNTAKNGGVVYSSSSANITIKNSEWSENTATNDGGAIYLTNKGTMTITDSKLNENTASSGGAITVSGATLNVTGTANEFKSNSASTGGAISVEKNDDVASTVSITGAEFDANTAKTDGGAMHVSGSELTVTNSKFLKNNTTTENRGGGVLYCTGATVNMDAVEFTENSASWGGVFNIRTNSVVTVTSGTFGNNTATLLGGAVYVKHATLNLVEGESKTIEMTGNKATTAGGAIYACGNPTVNVTGATISGSEASYGGALAAETYGTTDTITLTSTTLSNNKAVVDSDELGGGAIYVDTATVNLVDSTLTGNSAVKRGGAIYATNDATVTTKGTAFRSNTAGERGGAISAVTVASVSIDSSSFIANTAATYGSAVFVSEATSVSWANSTSFADHKGGTGAVAYIHKVDDFTATNVSLTDNTSNNNGILYVHTTTGTLDNVTATGNTAKNGGVLYASSNSVLTLKNSAWSANKATASGGAIYLGKGTLTISNTTLGGDTAEKGNSAANGGAIRVGDEDSTAQLIITNSTLKNNKADGKGGVLSTGTKCPGIVINATNCVFSGNHAVSNGGVIEVQNGNGYSNGDPTKLDIVFTDCEYTDNTTDGSGAIFDVRTASYIKFDGIKATGNSAEKGYGGFGYLTSKNSRVYIDGTVSVSDNVGKKGSTFIAFGSYTANHPRIITTHSSNADWVSGLYGTITITYDVTTMP